MKKYYNSKTNSWYVEGRSLTIKTEEGLFSGIPTEEQLTEWGYELHIEPTPEPLSDEQQEVIDRLRRMNAILAELKAMDYLTSKYIDGEDMTKYDEQYNGDWKEYRKGLREEYNILENLINNENTIV